MPMTNQESILWDAYYAEFDTKDNRENLVAALREDFQWQEGTAVTTIATVANAVRLFVAGLSGEAFVAMYRTYYDAPPFARWSDTSGYEQPYTDGPPYGRAVGPDDPR